MKIDTKHAPIDTSRQAVDRMCGHLLSGNVMVGGQPVHEAAAAMIEALLERAERAEAAH